MLLSRQLKVIFCLEFHFLTVYILGDLKLHEYIGDSYCILFSHPADYTPVCTTELGQVAKYANQFKVSILFSNLKRIKF